MTASSSNPALVSNPLVTYNGGSAATLRFTIASFQSGVSNIRVFVTDAGYFISFIWRVGERGACDRTVAPLKHIYALTFYNQLYSHQNKNTKLTLVVLPVAAPPATALK